MNYAEKRERRERFEAAAALGFLVALFAITIAFFVYLEKTCILNEDTGIYTCISE